MQCCSEELTLFPPIIAGVPQLRICPSVPPAWVASATATGPAHSVVGNEDPEDDEQGSTATAKGGSSSMVCFLLPNCHSLTCHGR